MIAEECLARSRLFQRLENRCHRQLIECCERQLRRMDCGRSSHAALQTVRENPRSKPVRHSLALGINRGMDHPTTREIYGSRVEGGQAQRRIGLM